MQGEDECLEARKEASGENSLLTHCSWPFGLCDGEKYGLCEGEKQTTNDIQRAVFLWRPSQECERLGEPALATLVVPSASHCCACSPCPTALACCTFPNQLAYYNLGETSRIFGG